LLTVLVPWSSSLLPPLARPFWPLLAPPRQDACPLCAEGTYPLTGTCLVCPAGKHKASSGNQDCTVCPAGKYSPLGAGLQHCTECALGFYETTAEQGECAGKCPAGTKGTAGGEATEALACTACPAGEYQLDAGQVSTVGALQWPVAGSVAGSQCRRSAGTV
jgi:hypothetical protein